MSISPYEPVILSGTRRSAANRSYRRTVLPAGKSAVLSQKKTVAAKRKDVNPLGATQPVRKKSPVMARSLERLAPELLSLIPVRTEGSINWTQPATFVSLVWECSRWPSAIFKHRPPPLSPISTTHTLQGRTAAPVMPGSLVDVSLTAASRALPWHPAMVWGSRNGRGSGGSSPNKV